MSLSQEVNKLDSGLLTQALEFAAHVTNNFDAVNSACAEMGIPQSKGYAFVQLLAELGISGGTSIHTEAELNELAESIEATMS